MAVQSIWMPCPAENMNIEGSAVALAQKSDICFALNSVRWSQQLSRVPLCSDKMAFFIYT